MIKLVLLRHGESLWNQENRFTGWTDVDLAEKGIQEAKKAGKLLRENGFVFDMAYTSVLKRAIRTLWFVLEELDQTWIPVTRNWRLNERMYGALQGLNKAETVAKHGEEQVHIWRRSYDIPPPPITLEDERHPSKDPRYKDLRPTELPITESLKDTVQRMLPYWTTEIEPKILSGKRILIVAHGNSLRALMKHLNQISDEEITQVNIPTGVPIVYEFTDEGSVIRNYFLGDLKEVAKAQESVKNQTQKNHG